MRNTNPIPCFDEELVTGYYDPSEDYQYIAFSQPKTKEEYEDWYCSRKWGKIYDKEEKPILPKNNWDKLFHKED